jgi:hypothetical protein
MKPIQIISQDLFDKVRSRFQNLEMGDETGAVTIDPAEARFFDFDVIIKDNNIGRVSISLNDLGSLKVYYSQGITENYDDIVKKQWFGFLKEMRFFAMRRLLRFDTRDIAKNNLDKNDFQHLAKTQAPKEDDMTTMNESKWNSKSSKKTSRAVQGRTEVIMRHARPVDEEYAGSRSQRKNIKAIFIQNADGERFKYPFIHPAGAFAMAQHVDHGGVPHDPAGKAIVNMSEQIAQLQEFQRKVHRATLHDDATGITERAVGRLQELKAQVECLGKRQHYQNWIDKFNGGEDDSTMLDAVTMEEYKQKFTQTKFEEDLAQYFPLLHKIMSETNTVDLESYVNEGNDDDACPDCGEHHDGACKDDDNKITKESFNEFSEWAEAVEQGKLTDDQIETLKKEVEDLPDGKLQHDYPELLVALGMSDNKPVAKEPQAGEEQAAAENQEQGGFPNKTMPTREAVVKEVAKLVKSRFNESNPEVGPFNGAPNIALEVKKSCSEKFGEEIGEQAESLAIEFMEKLSKKWEEKHGPVQPDGLARLRELLGNVKTKIESIGDVGRPGNNIMSAEEVKKSEIPASQRKEKGGDWKVSHQDLEKEKNASPTTKQGMKDLGKKIGMSEEFSDIMKLSGLAK